MTCFRFLVCVLFLVTITGCGGNSGPSKSKIKGKVTYNGEPIAEGDISFSPDNADGIPTAAPIRNGIYETDSRFGIAAGTYKVSIVAYKKKDNVKNELGEARPDPTGILSREQILPEKFNTKSELEALTVTGTEGTIEKNYDLKE
ncbi:MAG: hypothetical protein ACKVT0_22225 [Planctomycetaceae bacterium]